MVALAVSGTPASFKVPATGVSASAVETSEVRRCAHLFSSICSPSIASLSEDQRERSATHMLQTLLVGVSVKAVSRLRNVDRFREIVQPGSIVGGHVLKRASR